MTKYYKITTTDAIEKYNYLISKNYKIFGSH